MKDNLIRLKALILAGTIMVSGVSLSGCSGEKKDEEPTVQQEVTIQNFTECFGIGEHTISVPITSSVKNEVVQHEFHPGYEPVGITMRAYGKITDFFDGGSILYSNTSEVECNATDVDRDGTIVFNEFGTPVEYENSSSYEADGEKIFGVGEHIISVPLPVSLRTKENVQLPTYPGYEIVGVASSSYGEITGFNGGGALLLKNVVPVKCILSDSGYNSIGIPVEKENVKVLN